MSGVFTGCVRLWRTTKRLRNKLFIEANTEIANKGQIIL